MSDEQPSEESTEPTEGDRREHTERRSLIDLTRSERGEPERRRLPGLERRGPVDDEDETPPADR